MRRRLLLLTVDLCLIALATVAALALRDNLEVSLSRLQGLMPYLAVTLAAAVPGLIGMGLNRSIWRLSALADYLRVIAAVVLIVLSAVALGFVVDRLEGVARSLPILQGVLMMLALVGVRVLIRQRHALRQRIPAVLAAMPEATQARETVLVVGLNRITELYLQSVAEFGADRISVAGLLARSAHHTGRLVHRQKVLGTPAEVVEVVRDLDLRGVYIDRIVVTAAFGQLEPEAQAALLEIERSSGIKLDLFAEHLSLGSGSGATLTRKQANLGSKNDDTVFSFAAADLETLAQRPYWRVKRVLDVIGAIALIAALAPVMPLMVVLVAIDLGLPVIFWQQRPGLGGRPFKLYKLRTMGAAHDRNGRRLTDTDRLSAVGKFMRRTRLDELPQLYHILIGDMSFVGPRPLLPLDQPSAYGARLLVRPGLTGWAQITGGRDIAPGDKAALDVWYVKNASLALDMQILARTVPMVMLGERVNRAAVQRAWQELWRAQVCTSQAFAASQGRLEASLGGVSTKQAA